MAYAPTVTVTKLPAAGGRRQWRVQVAEVDASAASEWSVPASHGLPQVGTITHYQATLGAGTGTTIQPKLGKAASFAASSQDEIAVQDAAAAHVNDATPVPYTLTAGGAIYGCSQVDGGSDNVVTTVFVITEGHPL